MARNDVGAGLPRISVVTPSYNQGRFLEACIRSVLGQNYPNLEYIVIDGGSSDNSDEIIRSFAKDLAYWVSEPDEGQYHALNKGFRRATGDILAWLNADDMYTPWTFRAVAAVFEALPEVEWLSSTFPMFWGEDDIVTRCANVQGFDRRVTLQRLRGVQQESTFWRRSLWERAGGALDTSWKLAADLELWLRFWQHAELHGLAVPLGGIRRHPEQRHFRYWPEYLAEAAAIRRQYGGGPEGELRRRARGLIRAVRPFVAGSRRLSGLCARWGSYRGRVIAQLRNGTWHVTEVHFDA